MVHAKAITESRRLFFKTAMMYEIIPRETPADCRFNCASELHSQKRNIYTETVF